MYPHLLSRTAASHGRVVLVPHLRYLRSMRAALQVVRSNCDEMLSTLVLHPQVLLNLRAERRQQIGRVVVHNARCGVRIRSLRWTVDRIAGADFVLTRQPAWRDPGAGLRRSVGSVRPGIYRRHCQMGGLGGLSRVKLEFVRTAGEGRVWWQRHGRHGRIRSLQPLIQAFPYPIASPRTRERIARIP